MTIWDLNKQKSAVVNTLCSTLNASLTKRLMEMGFVPGQSLTCIRRTAFKGPVIIQIQDCVYSIDKPIAEKIGIEAS